MRFEDRRVGELKFIEAYTKQLLVKWAAEQFLPGGHFRVEPKDTLFHQFAVYKGWVFKRDHRKLKDSALQIAASTCKASTGGGGWRPS